MTTTEEFAIDGMHCERCVEAVRTTLKSVPGTTVHDVEIGTARVAYDSSVVSREQGAEALADAGYPLAS